MIPKRIIQIWGGEKELTLLSKASIENIKLINSDFEYVFFDNDRIEYFLRYEVPEYRTIFHKFHFPIQKYDFLRYLIIYQYGGFYMDTDILLAKNLNSLLDSMCVFPFERLSWSRYLRQKYKMDWEIGNYAFGAVKNHPFIYAIINNCLKAISDKKWRDEILRPFPSLVRKDLLVIYTTGPGLVSRTLGEYLNYDYPIKILFPNNVYDKNNWNKFGDYGVHLMQSSWRDSKRNFKRRVIDFLEIKNEKRAINYARNIGKTRSYSAKKQ